MIRSLDASTTRFGVRCANNFKQVPNKPPVQLPCRANPAPRHSAASTVVKLTQHVLVLVYKLSRKLDNLRRRASNSGLDPDTPSLRDEPHRLLGRSCNSSSISGGSGPSPIPQLSYSLRSISTLKPPASFYSIQHLCYRWERVYGPSRGCAHPSYLASSTDFGSRSWPQGRIGASWWCFPLYTLTNGYKTSYT